MDQTILALCVYNNMMHGQAIAFARELRETAAHLDETHAGQTVKPRGAARSGRWNKAKRAVEVLEYSSFHEALACIREGARWYEKIGELGFGVDART